MKTNKMQSVWRLLTALMLLTVGLFAFTPTVYAAEINNSGIVKAGEVINDDLFLSGETVRMDGEVNGLLLATGNAVIINGIVNGDLIALGSSVTVTEDAVIDGNIFSGAQNITINGKVTGSLFAGSATLNNGATSIISRNQYFGGYSFTQSKGAVTDRDIRAAVYQASLDGETGQDAVIYGEAVEVTGSIKRNAEFLVGTPTNQVEPMSPFMGNMGVTRNLKPGLRVDPAAVIGGVMTYTSKVNQSSSIAATPAGGIVFQTPVPESTGESVETPPTPVTQAVGVFTGFARIAGNLISLLLIGALILWKAPALLNETAEMVKAKPWASTGYGFVVILVGYAAATLALMVIVIAGIIIGFITIGGLGGVTVGLGLSSLATATSIFSLCVFYVSKIIVSFVFGKWIFSKLAPENTSNIWPLVIGILIYVILDSIPFLNFLVELAFILLGVGAIWLVYRARTTKAVEILTA
ncbi:MAG: polymer-forming cytoskeletal protein [Leptolinea sp.]|nr:polymer-forming cytoskeletal protein [Leptolinea sp.]